MKKITILVIFTLLEMSASLGAHSVSLAASVNITATVASFCGNNIRELSEQCDGSDLGDATCQSLGYTSGVLACKVNCTFNVSNCTSGGGGGGGGYVPPISITQVIFYGRAYPKSTITLLKDAQIVATTIADDTAKFQLTLTGLTAGNYIFSLYSEDKYGNRSSLLTFPLSVTANVTTEVSNIFIAPTIDVDKSEVKRGDNIGIFGQSTPQSDIIISVHSDEEYFAKTTSDKNGAYLYNFDTSFLDYGSHYTKSKASIGNQLISSFSYSMNFTVGTNNVLKIPTTKVIKGDLNSDKKVNLVDFSILAYWYKRSSPPLNVDLNKDGKIDLIDFSIMAYYWTG